MNAQLYCTVGELVADLNLTGDDGTLFDRIKAASQYIERRFGNFIPRKAVKEFRESGTSLRVDPLLTVTAIKNNDSVITDYDLFPLARYWENGPYGRIELGSGAWDVVEITGLWGKYNETQSLGEAITQTDEAAEISVSNGAILSIGTVLALGDEQQLVTGVGDPTAALSVVTAAVDAAENEIPVTNGAEFHRGEVIQVSTEDLFIFRVVGNTLVCKRGWNGAARKAILKDTPIGVYRTFSVVRGVNGTAAAAHDAAALGRYLPPWDVNWLCRQVTGLMVKKAQAGFAGKVGSVELGEAFYFNEFPSQVDKIQQNYRIVSL
jgi:hypothetical protein